MFAPVQLVPIAVVLAFGLTAFAGNHARAEVARSIPEILTVVTATGRNITSLSYESETVGRMANTPGGVSRRTLHNAAVQGGNRYVESIHLLPGYDWTDDLDHTRQSLFEGKLTVLLFRTRICETTVRLASPEANPKVRTIYNELYLDCIGWMPPGGTLASESGTLNSLPNGLDAFLRIEGVQIRSESELVDGRSCVLVASPLGNDLVWLDMERGGVIVQRHQKLEDENMFIVYANSDFREMANGVWLPWRVSRTIHRGPAPGIMPDGERDIFATATRTIHRLEINNTGPEDFVAALPPGTISVDRDSERESVIPGGEDLLDEMIRIARKSADHQSQPLWNPAKLLLLAGCLIVGFSAAYAATQRRRSHLTAQRANVGESPIG